MKKLPFVALLALLFLLNCESEPVELPEPIEIECESNILFSWTTGSDGLKKNLNITRKEYCLSGLQFIPEGKDPEHFIQDEMRLFFDLCNKIFTPAKDEFIPGVADQVDALKMAIEEFECYLEKKHDGINIKFKQAIAQDCMEPSCPLYGYKEFKECPPIGSEPQ